MALCPECYLQSYCRRLKSRVVTDDELTPAFVRDLRRHAHALAIPCGRWPDFLSDQYGDYIGQIVDTDGQEVMLDMDVFERPNIRYWFRDFCKAVPADITPRVKRSVAMRIATMATILRAIHPVPASLWGKDIANDERPAPFLPDRERARYVCPVKLDWSGQPCGPVTLIPPHSRRRRK